MLVCFFLLKVFFCYLRLFIISFVIYNYHIVARQPIVVCHCWYFVDIVVLVIRQLLAFVIFWQMITVIFNRNTFSPPFNGDHFDAVSAFQEVFLEVKDQMRTTTILTEKKRRVSEYCIIMWRRTDSVVYWLACSPEVWSIVGSCPDQVKQKLLNWYVQPLH